LDRILSPIGRGGRIKKTRARKEKLSRKSKGGQRQFAPLLAKLP